MSILEEVQEFQARLLVLVGVELDFTIETTEESLVVRLSGPDRDLMLQDRAELLEANQYLLTRIFANRLEPGRRIVVDCDGFRERKEQELRAIALKASEKAKRTGLSQELGLMNPYERRIVHLAVAEDAAVTSSSRGEGFLKRVTISPASR